MTISLPHRKFQHHPNTENHPDCSSKSTCGPAQTPIHYKIKMCITCISIVCLISSISTTTAATNRNNAAQPHRMLVLTDVHSAQLTAYGRFIAREIINAFSDKNVECINSSQLQRSHDEFLKLKTENPGGNTPHLIGQKYNAQLVLILDFSCDSKEFDPASKKSVAKGRLTATITDMSSGKVILSKKIHSRQHFHTTKREAIQAAMSEMAGKFVAEALPVIQERH